MADFIDVEVLADGSIKVLTEQVSPANHMQAEALVNFLKDNMGGKTKRTKRADGRKTTEHRHKVGHGHSH